MKLQLDKPAGKNQFTGYGPGFVDINAVRYEQSVIVLPERIIDWRIERFDQLTLEVFQQLASLEIEILLLGTGTTLRFPAHGALKPLHQAGIGVEVMDSQAACRTYNILLGEDRRIAAAILLPEGSTR